MFFLITALRYSSWADRSGVTAPPACKPWTEIVRLSWFSPFSLLSFKSSPHPPPVILCGGFRVAVNIHIKYLQSWHKDNSYSFKYEVILVHNKNKTFRLYQVFRFGKSQLRRTEKLSLNQNQCVKSTTHYSGCRSTFSSKIWKESFDEWFYWSELWNTFLCNIAKFMYSSLVVLPQHRRLRSGIWLDHCNMRHVTTRCSSWVSLSTAHCHCRCQAL